MQSALLCRHGLETFTSLRMTDQTYAIFLSCSTAPTCSNTAKSNSPPHLARPVQLMTAVPITWKLFSQRVTNVLGSWKCLEAHIQLASRAHNLIEFRSIQPFKGQMCHLVTICHPSLTYIFNFWHSGTLTLSPERQSARMSEITI